MQSRIITVSVVAERALLVPTRAVALDGSGVRRVLAKPVMVPPA